MIPGFVSIRFDRLARTSVVRTWLCVVGVCVLAMTLVGVGGCATPGAVKTSRLGVAEMRGAWSEVAQKLAESPFLAGRTASSPRIVLVAAPMTNLTMERLSRADQVVIVDRLLFNEGVQQMLRERNVAVIVPPEEYERMQRFLASPHTIPMEDRPTHVLNTLVESVTRAGAVKGAAGASGRTDTIALNFTITEIQTGRIEWSGRWEFQRTAHGLLAD